MTFAFYLKYFNLNFAKDSQIKYFSIAIIDLKSLILEFMIIIIVECLKYFKFIILLVAAFYHLKPFNFKLAQEILIIEIFLVFMESFLNSLSFFTVIFY